MILLGRKTQFVTELTLQISGEGIDFLIYSTE